MQDGLDRLVERLHDPEHRGHSPVGLDDAGGDRMKRGLEHARQEPGDLLSIHRQW
jgi:hypothetical protein